MVSLSHIKMFLPVIVHLLMLIFLLQMLTGTPCRMLMPCAGGYWQRAFHIKMDWIEIVMLDLTVLWLLPERLITNSTTAVTTLPF